VVQSSQQKSIDSLLTAGFVLLIVILIGLYFSVSPDETVSAQFKAEHDCKKRSAKGATSELCAEAKASYHWRQQR
jgi:hypothetical protein